MSQICYCYDGSFGGYLSCVYDSYVNKIEPQAFRTREDGPTLWEEREIETRPAQARRVYAALGKISPSLQKLVAEGFLTYLPTRELDLFTLIRRGFQEGRRVMLDQSDPVMARVRLAQRKLWAEEDHLKGFVRFSELDGVLVGEIEPKNRILPLLAPHFAGRLSGEQLVLCDRTHREAFFYTNYRWRILPVEEFQMGPAGEREKNFRALWRKYFKTIAIEGRTNPKCQSTHMPLRYRGVMTEFLTDEPLDPALPGHPTGEGRALAPENR